MGIAIFVYFPVALFVYAVLVQLTYGDIAQLTYADILVAMISGELRILRSDPVILRNALRAFSGVIL